LVIHLISLKFSSLSLSWFGSCSKNKSRRRSEGNPSLSSPLSFFLSLLLSPLYSLS
jgi:hypothetical protein